MPTSFFSKASSSAIFLVFAACADNSDPGAAASDQALAGASASGVCPAMATGRTIRVARSGGDASTIAAGLAAAAPGDRVLVAPGEYHESVAFPRSGSAARGCIVLEGQAGAILDGRGAGNVGILIESKSYVAVVGMTVRNYRGGSVPIGISVTGSANHVEVRKNLVDGIVSSEDAHGIAFYGTSSTPMSDLLIDENEIRNCKLGSSESMVLNGNVTNFVVSRNRVHDNDNIGIDFIGFEGQGPAGSDQARNGVCVDNIVYNISSAQNPAYHGERSADGLYVDGGRDIVLERNKVDNSDIGIEIASEHGGRTTSNITVRNNFVTGSFQGNVMMGGYDADRGNAANIAVVNNTLFHGGSGEIIVQHNAKTVTIANNVLVAKAGAPYVTQTGGNNTAIAVTQNLYFGASTSSPGTWPDRTAKFADPRLVSAPTDLHLGAGSPAVDAGKDLGALSGATDIDGSPRTNGVIDLGADER